MAKLNDIMRENEIENEKLFGAAFKRRSQSTAFPNEEIESTFNSKAFDPTHTVLLKSNEVLFNSKTATPGHSGDVSQDALASLSPGVLKQSLPGLEGDTIIVDARALKERSTGRDLPAESMAKSTTRNLLQVKGISSTAPAKTCEVTQPKSQGIDVRNNPRMSQAGLPTKSIPPIPLMMSGQATTAAVSNVQQPELAVVHEMGASVQETVPKSIALQAHRPQPDRFKEHCAYISGGLSEVLNTQSLFDLARPDQVGLAQDLHAVFETTLRHLDADIRWVFTKHGDGI
jgi:hypothetical protein